jgi:hypothetical protein
MMGVRVLILEEFATSLVIRRLKPDHSDLALACLPP